MRVLALKTGGCRIQHFIAFWCHCANIRAVLSAISRELLACAGAVAYTLLLFAPGAWIMCGLELKEVPFWARIFTAAMLSPLIVCIQFYLMRLMGISFAVTSVLLVVLNLPPLYLLWKRRRKPASLARGDWLVAGVAVAVPALCLIALLTIPTARVFSAHGWIHADAVYMLARGDLILEAPTLAGIRLSYPPWGPLVLPAVQSFLVQSPPVLTYIWSDLVWMIVYFGFAAGIAGEMGGGTLARIGSGVWLVLGTHPIGYMIMQRWPGGIFGYCCDDRTIRSFDKFHLFGPMAVALGMLMAIIYFLIRSGPLTTGMLTVIFLLLTGIGLLYPLLFPPACCVIGARALALLVDGRQVRWPAVRREWLWWAGLLLIAGALTYGEVRFLTVDRHTAESTVSLNGKGFGARKLLAALIVTSLFVCGWLFTVRRCWKSRRMATAVLSVAAAASYLLYALFHIPFYDNEYKFVFAAAMCLTVFPGLAVERMWREWPRKMSVPALTVLVILVLGTYGHYLWGDWPAIWARPRPPGARSYGREPILDTSGFHLKLDRRERWSGIVDAVFRMTPPEAILVIDDNTLYYPGLMGRSLYVATSGEVFPGINLPMDALDADIRGYGREILNQRLATQVELFGADDCCRAAAIDTILALKRPIAIVTEPQHVELTEWLKQSTRARQLYAGDGLALWLINGSAAHL